MPEDNKINFVGKFLNTLTIKKAVILIIVIGLIVFANSLFNGFVWDDETQILNQPLVQSLKNLPLIFSVGNYSFGGSSRFTDLYYRPFSNLSYLIIYVTAGSNAFFFHLVSVIFHILNAVLVFFILIELLSHIKGDNTFFPLILAVIFLVHPLNVETVAYVSAFQDVFFFFFGACALFIATKKPSIINSLFIGLSLFSSLLFKETGILFLVIVLLYGLLFKFSRKISSIFYIIFPVAATLITYFSLRLWIVSQSVNNLSVKHIISPIYSLPVITRLINVPATIVYYIKILFFPAALRIDQEWFITKASIWGFYVPIIVLFAIFLIQFLLGRYIYSRSKNTFKIYLFFLIWFLFGLGFLIHLIPLDFTVSDRWFYFPFAGFLGETGVLVSVLRMNRIQFKLFSLFIFLIIIALSVRTVIRNGNWKNNLTLYTHDAKILPQSNFLEHNLGVELIRNGKIDDAKIHLENSIRLAPDWWVNWNSLGFYYEQKGDYTQAKSYYQKAIDNGDYVISYENEAKIIMFRESNASEAAKFSTNALLKHPDDYPLWLILAISDYKLGKTDDALKAVQKSISIFPGPDNQNFYNFLIQNSRP